jgi:hypothetical protein
MAGGEAGVISKFNNSLLILYKFVVNLPYSFFLCLLLFYPVSVWALMSGQISWAIFTGSRENRIKPFLCYAVLKNGCFPICYQAYPKS